MSSPYVKLGDRSLDQWRVVDLKEELKRRRLPINGLKKDLVKRLDEAIRIEMETVSQKGDSSPINTGQSELQPEHEKSQRAVDPQEIVVNTDDKVSGDIAQEIDAVDANLVHEANDSAHLGDTGASLQDIETQNEATEIKWETENGPKSEGTNSGGNIGIQLNSDTVSAETVFSTEKNEVTPDFHIDKVNLELDAKHEVEQQPLCGTVIGGGESHPLDVEEPPGKKDIEVSIENNVDIVKDLNSGKLGPEEQLNLEGNSGDDSMGEDILQNKEVDDESAPTVINSNFHKVGKRKLNDQECIEINDALKKSRRLNLEGYKVSDPQIGNSASATTPKAKDLSTFKRVPGNEPVLNDEAPNERHVPPSAKPPTNCLRIDQFLRPFTLKAVQELLGKTGTVTDFWMDQIKTHCYVSYSSEEEAIETRNAVYNLQWPTNGERLLVAEFVDPQEVKSRLEAPPSTHEPQQSQPLMRQQVPNNHLPQPQPPPPPPSVKERLSRAPPPPVPEEVDQPIVTLDDLFRKTRATPCIYYLPLSEEEVAGKL